jgi:hypothetical protein
VPLTRLQTGGRDCTLAHRPRARFHLPAQRAEPADARTWGTNATGAVVDEHFITFDLDPDDLEGFTRAAHRGVYWVVVDDAPQPGIVVHNLR